MVDDEDGPIAETLLDLGDDFYPMGFCPECQKQTLLSITTWVKEEENLEIDVASCPICDSVLNFEEDFKISYISERQAAELGWFKDEELIPDLSEP